jgi:hypothetical protein
MSIRWISAAADLAGARARAESLLAQAAELAPAFGERHPQCAEYLAASLRVRGARPTLDAATIERDYHDDAAIPKVATNGAVRCHMKDLIVHPATALVLLSQPGANLAQSKQEIEEVLAHVAAGRGALAP